MLRKRLQSLKQIFCKGQPAVYILLAVNLGLVACADKEIPVVEPRELSPLDSQVELKKLWGLKVGEGLDEDEIPSLQPAVNGATLIAAGKDGRVSVINSLNGTVIWQKELEENLLGGVGLDNQHLYLSNKGGELLAFALSDGSLVWQATTTSEVIAPPSSDGLIVSVYSIDGKVFTFDAQTGKQLWTQASRVPILTLRGSSTPVVTSKYVLAGFANGRLKAFSRDNGSTIWQRRIGVPTGRTELERLVDIDSTPLIFADVIYVSTFAGKTMALDLNSGRPKWQQDFSSTRPLEVDVSRLYLVTNTSNIVALSTDNGEPVWRQDALEGRKLSAPVLWESWLVVADFEGYIHLLGKETGELVARVRPTRDPVSLKPVVSEGNLLLLTQDEEIVAIRASELPVSTEEADAQDKDDSATDGESIPLLDHSIQTLKGWIPSW